MKRNLGIARCGLACCLCSENKTCSGCDSGECPDKDWCENRQCSVSKKIDHCYKCNEKCRKGLLVFHPVSNGTLRCRKNLLYSIKNDIGGRRYATLHCHADEQ